MSLSAPTNFWPSWSPAKPGESSETGEIFQDNSSQASPYFFLKTLIKNHVKMPETEVEVKRPTRLKKMPAGRAASVDNVMIERKNKQLNQATKKLEEKVKSLQERSKTRSLPRVAKVRQFNSKSEIQKSHSCNPLEKKYLRWKSFSLIIIVIVQIDHSWLQTHLTSSTSRFLW